VVIVAVWDGVDVDESFTCDRIRPPRSRRKPWHGVMHSAWATRGDNIKRSLWQYHPRDGYFARAGHRVMPREGWKFRAAPGGRLRFERHKPSLVWLTSSQ